MYNCIRGFNCYKCQSTAMPLSVVTSHHSMYAEVKCIRCEKILEQDTVYWCFLQREKKANELQRPYPASVEYRTDVPARRQISN